MIKFFKLMSQLIYWKFKDINDAIKNKPKLHLYGIWLFVGLYGQGKTMALTEYLDRMRALYGDAVIIITNYFYKGQDEHLAHWDQLLKVYDKPVIFAYDEIQNDFNSRDYESFPVELLTMLTQNRKGHGKQIIGTAQRFTRVDKVFRELCQQVVTCNTIFGRLTSTKYYDWEDYETLINTPQINKKINIKPKMTYRFVQTDKLRDQYDSFQTLASATAKTYSKRTEIRALI